jgi:hypothetical protein
MPPKKAKNASQDNSELLKRFGCGNKDIVNLLL